MNKKFDKFLISISAAVFLISCHSKPITWIDDRSMYEKSGIESLRTNAQIQIAHESKKYKFQTNILMNKDGFFIQANGFGVPSAYASLLSNRLTILLASEGKAYIGNEHSSLKNLLNVDIQPDQIQKMLMLKDVQNPTHEYGAPIEGLSKKFPQFIRVKHEKDVLQMEFSNVEINPTVDSRAFQINIPSDGFKVYSLE